MQSTLTRPYDPDPLGLEEARTAVADYYEERGITLSPGHVALTASTSEAYTWLAQLLCEPGEGLAVPEPSYPLFEHLLRLECVESRPYRLTYEGEWYLGGGALERLNTMKPLRGIVIVSPNNPTGHVLDRGMFERLADVAVARDLPLIVDEVFGDYPVDVETLPSVLTHLRDRPSEERPLTFVLSGLSKVAGLPGAKMSWMGIEGPPDRREEAIERLAFIADAFLSVSTITQRAAPTILDQLAPFQDAIQQRLRTNRRQVRARAASSPCTAYPVEGGWYQVVQLPGFIDESDIVLELLEDCNVVVQPGFFYDFEAGSHLVISLLTPETEFERGVQALIEKVEARVG